MLTKPSARQKLGILSLVEALTVTGPVKPLLMFAALRRDEPAQYGSISHTLMTTRRSPPSGENTSDELYKAARAAGLEYITIQERAAFDLGVLPKMFRAMQKMRPDIVETHDSKSHFLFFILRILHAGLRRTKWIAFHHGYTRTTWKVFLYQQLDRLTLRYADRVVTVCRPFAQMLERRGVAAAKLSVISNAIAYRAPPSAEIAAQARALLGVGAHECLLLCVGRLSSEKGQDDLLAALALALADPKVPSLRLAIVGDGPERTRLTHLAAPLGPKVVFTGHMADPWPLFHAADIFVLPSHSEGSPLVLFEAMASGLPIIATDVGGVPEILVDLETAMLVPARMPAALGAAIIALSSDLTLRLKLAGRASLTLPDFSPVCYAKHLLDIYASALGEAIGAAHKSSDSQRAGTA